MLKPILTYNIEVWFQLSPRQLKRLDQVKDYEQLLFDTNLHDIGARVTLYRITIGAEQRGVTFTP